MESKGLFENGLEQGLWITWYQNGRKKYEVNYVNGKKEGEFKSWHKNGQKEREGLFKDDIPFGSFYIWDEKGIILKSEIWEKGVLKETLGVDDALK